MKHRSCLICLAVVLAGCHRQPENPYLKRIPHLELEARVSGDWGFMTLVTETDRIVVDTRHPFTGRDVRLEHLLELLHARADSNRTGEGPMVGDVSHLCFVILYTLAEVPKQSVVEAAIPLLQDEKEMIRDYAATLLIKIGTEDPVLRETIAVIEFPAPFHAHTGVPIPDWVRVVEQE